MSVAISFEISLPQISAAIDSEIEKKIEPGLNEIVDELLVMIAQTQILAYTATAQPARPAGSKYVRTFTLRSASRTEHAGRRLPDISGEWSAATSVARYAEYVLGSRADQAPIHRGRWKSEEEVVDAILPKIPGLVRKHFKESQ